MYGVQQSRNRQAAVVRIFASLRRKIRVEVCGRGNSGFCWTLLALLAVARRLLLCSLLLTIIGRSSSGGSLGSSSWGGGAFRLNRFDCGFLFTGLRFWLLPPAASLYRSCLKLLFAIPVTMMTCVGRRSSGMGRGNSPWAARAVNDNAHNFFLTRK